MGCLAVPVVLVALLGGAGWWWTARQARLEAEAEAAQAAAAAEAFGPALDQLEAEGPSYDLDRTVRVIHSIDLALQEHDDFEGYLRYMATQDYRDVAPEVLEARKELLGVLQPLYAKQTEIEDQQAMWEMTSELMLATLSVVSVSGDVDMVSPSGEFSVDREQARTLWADLRQRQEAKRALQRDIDALEEELVDALVGYAEVYYDYVDQWDQLSILRDRAYLAVHNGDWAAAEAAARAAVAQAPKEREAHLLLALALVEGGDPEDLTEARRVLDEVMAEHPDQTAPALLLLGAVDAAEGDREGARLAFQQSAAYYPRQADALLDMLDPYRMRSFLKDSREGSFIVEQYKATMLGTGYFSPDLQLAKMLFDGGDFVGGKQKVLDHFARRRTQKQWDFILSDIAFCQELLGPDFWQIFPEDSYLDLEVSEAMLGSALNLSVVNRSPKALRNATLVLALHFTDMYPGMYQALPATETVPTVPVHATTSFGSLEIAAEVGGVPKSVDDIVEHRAILVTNDAVLWVDTDAYKIAAADARDDARQTPRVGGATTSEPKGPAERHPEFLATRQEILAGLSQGLDLHIEQKYGADNVLIELPRELSILRPVFRLRYGDTLYTADDNVIDGDRIELRFAGVENFDDAADPEDLQLIVGSPFGDLVLTWNAQGQLTWDYAGLDAGPVP